MPADKFSIPNPFRLWVPKCFNKFSVAYASAKTHSSRAYVKNLLPKYSLKFFCCWRWKMTSAGCRLCSNLSAYSRSPSATKNSPVLMSKNAIPVLSSLKCSAAKKLLLLCSSSLSLVATPGVTNSVTPLFTIPFASFGSSNWSQIATL